MTKKKPTKKGPTKKKAAKRLPAKKPAAPRRRGRPPLYQIENHADEIVFWIESGKMLTDYCEQPGKPGKNVIHRWRERDAEFARRFELARQAWADELEEQALRIADTPVVGEIITEEEIPGEHGPVRRRKVVREDTVPARRLMVEARLKIAYRRSPKKVDLEHSGKLTLEELVCASMLDEGNGSGT